MIELVLAITTLAEWAAGAVIATALFVVVLVWLTRRHK